MSGTKGKSGVYPKSEEQKAKISATMKRKGIRPPQRIAGFGYVSDEQLLEDGICPECLNKLPSRKLEQRDGGYYEFVTTCLSCGSVFVG